MPQINLKDAQQISLCEALDRVLNKGVVIRGDITISVAEVELIYLELNLLLASTQALLNQKEQKQTQSITASI